MNYEDRTSLLKAGHAPPKLLIERRTEGPVTCLRLSGLIDEQFDGPGLARTVAARYLILDLGGVERISSFGIRQWIDFIGATRAEGLYYVECAPKIVDQFNMVANFGGPGQIVSFYAPYRCDTCDHDRRRLFRTDEETPLWRAGQAPGFACQMCGNPEYFEEDPATYFSFVAQHTPGPLPGPVASFLKSELSYGQGGQRKLKIEKRIDGRTTYVKLSGDLDSDLRAQKLAEGLEGDVVFDLSGVLSIDPVGTAQWRKLLQLLSAATPGQGEAVDRVHILAAPAIFLERLGRPDDLTPKGQVLSVLVPYNCPRCRATTQRLVDFIAHGHELRAGRVPRTQCSACGGPVSCVASETWLQRLGALPQPQLSEVQQQSIARLSQGAQGTTPAQAQRGMPPSRPALEPARGRPLPPPPGMGAAQSGPGGPAQAAGVPTPMMSRRDATPGYAPPVTQRMPVLGGRLVEWVRQALQVPGLLPGLLVVLLSLSAAIVYRILTPPEGRRLPGGWLVVETAPPRPQGWRTPGAEEPVFVGESAALPDRRQALDRAEDAALCALARRLAAVLSRKAPEWRETLPGLFTQEAQKAQDELAAAQRLVDEKKPGAEAALAAARLRVQEGEKRVAALLRQGMTGSTAPLPAQLYWEKRIRGERARPREIAYQATARIELSPEAWRLLGERYERGETWQGARFLPYFPMLGWRYDLPGGAVISQVPPQSPLFGAGLVVGDVVVAADGHEVRGPADLLSALVQAAERLAETGGVAMLKAQRGERLLDVQLVFPRKGKGQRPPPRRHGR